MASSRKFLTHVRIQINIFVSLLTLLRECNIQEISIERMFVQSEDSKQGIELKSEKARLVYLEIDSFEKLAYHPKIFTI